MKRVRIPKPKISIFLVADTNIYKVWNDTSVRAETRSHVRITKPVEIGEGENDLEGFPDRVYTTTPLASSTTPIFLALS
jgi:hypothetical protein